MLKLLYDHDDADDDAKAIAIPRVFSENSQTKNGLIWLLSIFCKCFKVGSGHNFVVR